MYTSMANSLITFLIIACFFFPPPTSCRSFNNETDFLSLLAFKSAIDLDPLGALRSWNQTRHYCSWNGIRCSQRHRDRVIEIQLRSQGLVGTLSPHLGNLSFLTTIALQNNIFRGQIPQQLTILKRLKTIELSNNSFSGPIPTNFTRNLVYLNLIDNKLSGNIPFELTSLHKLQALGLAMNNFSSGPIPPLIGNMTSLERLSLLSCGLTGEIPESIAQLRNLSFLQLSDNVLSGTIPSAIFNMSNLQIFAVFINNLHGIIPSTIGLTLPNLIYLLMEGNQFSGPIPASLSNASLLQRIELLDNHFTGRLPALGRLTDLQTLVIGGNSVEDDITNLISSLTNATQLVYLEVGDNLLHGSLPAASIGNLSTHLSSLIISNNNIRGKIPSSIGNLINLETLFLFQNYFEGQLPSEIAKLSKLIYFLAGVNKFSGTMPSFINFTLLSHLYLNQNNFSGNLPSTLGNLPNLLELDLSRNNFNGLIPQALTRLSSISIVFNLSHNAFEGSIPYEVASFVNLEALDLSDNRLSGVIPNSLSLCTSLQKLRLQGNLLEGEIPRGISGLMGLQDLDLSRNNLSGAIPSFLEKLNLQHLNLSFNDLQGEVPTRGVFTNKTSISLDGNERLCGGVAELRLRRCSVRKSNKISSLSTLLKILIPILVLGGTCLVVFLAFKRRMLRKTVIPSVPTSFTGVEFLRLSYADLLKATDEFSENNLVGGGRFGCVYKGVVVVDGETLVAVKVLNLFVRGASKSFLTECNALRNVRHRNLLKIVSVCESIDFKGNDFKALVYEFKANGSLEKFLHNGRKEDEDEEKEETSNVLNAIQRLNIAIDIAQAIEYLHFGTDSCIVHGDLKPSNILLDLEMNACVGDFGLAKIVSEIVPTHESCSSIGIRGTIGYVPPEYGTTNSVSTQGDVYSYGIVILEMFTNKRPTDDSFSDHVNLHGYVDAALPDRVMEIIDTQLIQTEARRTRNEKMKNCMAAVLSIGVSCSKEMPRERMLMSDVVNELHKIKKLFCN